MTAILAELSERNLRGALSLMHTLADEGRDCQSFVQSALEQLTTLVASDITTLSLCDLKKGTRAVFGRRAETLSDADRNAFDRHFREHPLVRFHGSNPRGPTQRISDCLEPGDFRNSAVYADYYRRLGIKHVMALPLRIDRHNVISIVFNRSRSDFRDAERAVLEALRPALAALYRNLVAREEAGLSLQSISDLAASGSWQMMRVTTAGRILDAAGPALQLLRALYPHEATARGSRLPAALTEWLSCSRSWGLDRVARRQGHRFAASRLGMRLTACFVPDPVDDDSGYLLLQGKRQEADAARLCALSLTKRESEVLALVTAGKTNADIATILDISPRTVQKHLEHIFDKLGVETRTAAAVRALTAADAT